MEKRSVYPDGLPTSPPLCLPACLTSVLMDVEEEGLKPVCFRLSEAFFAGLVEAYGVAEADIPKIEIKGVPVAVLPGNCTGSLLLATGPQYPMSMGGLYFPFDDTFPGVLPRPKRNAKVYQAPN